MCSKKWTEEEINLLKKNEGQNIDYLCELFPYRTKDSIINKCKRDKIKFGTKYNYFSDKDIEILFNNQNKTIKELQKLLSDKNMYSIYAQAKKHNIKIADGNNKWSYEEEEILRRNSGGLSTFEEIKKLLPNRSLQAIRSRFSTLRLSIFNINKIPIVQTDDYSKNSSKIQRYRSKWGIVLNKNDLIDTYDIIQWWKWLYYGAPNGKKLKCIPLELINDNNLIKLSKYIINNVLGYKSKGEILKIDSKTLIKYKIYFYKNFKICFCDYLNLVFPEYNFYPFELINVPLNYWKDVLNCDNYLEYILNNKLKFNINKDKVYLSSIFNAKNLRELGLGTLIYILQTYNHYNNFYEWLNKLHPEWDIKIENFNKHISYDGVILDSNEEVSLYNYLNNELKLNITANKKKNKFYNKKNNENYLPDFYIKKLRNIVLSKPFFIEYYGLFNIKNKSDLIKNYVQKTYRKNEFYKSNKDIYFIDLYPYDLKNNFQGVREKLTSFFMKNFNIQI